MGNVKILCTADLHLGRSSACLHRPDGVDLTAVGAWKRIVDRAISAGADVVAIAGDVFDSSGSLYEARDGFRAGLKRLEEAAIPVVAVTGNHDYDALRRFHVQHPGSFQLLGLNGWELKTIETKSGPVRFAGWSFTAASEPRSHLGELSPLLDSRMITVGLVHGDIATPDSPYHSVSPAELERLGDGWLLGHIHLPTRGLRWAYSGSPQALDFAPGERGLHGIHWMTIDERGALIGETESISTVHFCHKTVEVVPLPGQLPWEAAIDAATGLANRLRLTHAGVESVQLRLSVKLPPGSELPALSDRDEPLEDGLHSVRFLEFTAPPKVDLDSLMSSPTYSGELARMLTHFVSGQEVAPALLADCRAAIARQYSEILGKVQDSGDAERRQLSDEELEAMLAELIPTGGFEMLNRAIEAGGEAA